jgi:hypothetical protein
MACAGCQVVWQWHAVWYDNPQEHTLVCINACPRRQEPPTLPLLLMKNSLSTALSYGCMPQSKNWGVTSNLMLLDSPDSWNCGSNNNVGMA